MTQKLTNVIIYLHEKTINLVIYVESFETDSLVQL